MSVSGSGSGGRPHTAYSGVGGPRPGTGLRIASYLVLGGLGAAVGAAGALVQDGWFPGGLLLALAGCTGLFVGGRTITGTRLGAVVPGAVWLVTVMLLSTSRPEGDFLFTAGVGPYVYLLGGMLAAMVCATAPPRSPRP